jgi:hypothetical protein
MLTELDAECFFVLERASQEPAHLIISDLRNPTLTPVSYNFGLPLETDRCETDIIEEKFIEYFVADI